MAEEIALEIFWTDSAKATFNGIVEHLRREWSDKEVEKFMGRTEEMLFMLRRYPEMCRPSVKRKNVRIGILNKYTNWFIITGREKADRNTAFLGNETKPW